MLHLRILLVLGLVGCGGGAADEGPADNGGNGTSGAEDGQPVTSVEVEGGSIAAAIAGAHRPERNRARDPYRHPQETLEFFGLEAGMNVIEMAPGGGWYTQVIAPVLRDSGSLTLAVPDPAESSYTRSLIEQLEAHPEIYANANRVVFELPDQTSLGPDGSADMVLTFRSTHGWVNGGGAATVFQAMFSVLRPGGVLGVVQHRADVGAVATESAQAGYVPEAHVIELATAAGFVLDERSEINANPNDTHDHPSGVWTLPPALQLGDERREEFTAIGESDRMTLRFRRPAEEAAQ